MEAEPQNDVLRISIARIGWQIGIPDLAVQQYKYMIKHNRSLDQVVDLAEEASDKIDLYAVSSITDSANSFGQCLAQAGSQLAIALERFSASEDLVPVLEEIHRLENEGDRITRQALQQLFDSNHHSAVDLIKWKDIYALLESTLDECESAAEILESITIKKA